MGKKRTTTDALAIIGRRFFARRTDLEDASERESADLDVARKVYEVRTKAGLTQSALAKRVGTTTSVISRLEDPDYTGHSLSMLRRIAAALDRRVDIRFLPRHKARKSRAA